MQGSLFLWLFSSVFSNPKLALIKNKPQQPIPKPAAPSIQPLPSMCWKVKQHEQQSKQKQKTEHLEMTVFWMEHN